MHFLHRRLREKHGSAPNELLEPDTGHQRDDPSACRHLSYARARARDEFVGQQRAKGQTVTGPILSHSEASLGPLR
jgi:hypothetical protein